MSDGRSEGAGALLALQAFGFDRYLAEVDAGLNRAALAPHAAVGAVSRQLRRSFAERRLLASFGCEPEVTAHAFGEVAAVAVTLPLAQAHRQGSLLSLLARAASYAQRLAAVAPFPLAYRGVLATGRFSFSPGTGPGRRFFDGAPVREAAALLDRPRGALVFLSPSAVDTRAGLVIPDGWDELAQLAALPLAGGEIAETFVLSPYFGADTAERVPIRKGLLGSLAGADREATEAVLDALEAAVPRERPRQPLRTLARENFLGFA